MIFKVKITYFKFFHCFFNCYYIFLFVFVNINNGDLEMKKISIWKDNVKNRNYEKLGQNIDTDVLIIGGGITGVNVMYHLDNSGLKVTLVEQNKIGMGVTANSTGKLNYLQDHIYEKLLKNFDFNAASTYLKSQREAIQLAIDIIQNNKIDCDLVKTNAYVYTNQDKEIDKIGDLKDFLEKNEISVIESESSLVESKYMIGVEDTYLFHPVKFVLGLLQKSNFKDIYEDTSIKKIEKEENGYICFTDDYQIKAKWVVIASHYPYFSFPFLFPIKGSLEKSYLSASLKKIDPISLISYDNPFISIRNYQDYLIYLSNSHNISNKVDDQEHFDELIKKVSDLRIKPEYLWSNIDIMTNDGLPYVGEIQDHLVLATGYNTWGMTNGILAGKIVGDLILGKDNEYVELFDPKRQNIAMMSGGILDGYYSASGFVQGVVNKSDQIIYKELDGIRVAIYQDGKKEHIVVPKCPHMGCSLIFNEVEKTWDCPCHASRFDLDGKCISGPANQDISYKGNDKL